MPAEKPVQKIENALSTGSPVLMPYFTLGYPDYQTSLEVIEACITGGAGLIELGIPFSDPLADGLTIQYSSQVALERGINLERCFKAVRDLRSRGHDTPLIMMTYANPVFAHGQEMFLKNCLEVGVDGLIIPDLPPEEASSLETSCREAGLGMTYLLAPNSPENRIVQITARSSGFTYLVTVKGITGARSALPPGLDHFIALVRGYARTPLAVGFGISTPEQAAAVGQLADGVIVGSALINTVRKAVSEGKTPAEEARLFILSLKSALDGRD